MCSEEAAAAFSSARDTPRSTRHENVCCTERLKNACTEAPWSIAGLCAVLKQRSGLPGIRHSSQLGPLLINSPSTNSLAARCKVDTIHRHGGKEPRSCVRKMLKPMVHANLQRQAPAIESAEISAWLHHAHRTMRRCLTDHGKTRSAIVQPSQALCWKSRSPPPINSRLVRPPCQLAQSSTAESLCLRS